eukprot:5026182-Pyramimonas_sp.AAC.3
MRARPRPTWIAAAPLGLKMFLARHSRPSVSWRRVAVMAAVAPESVRPNRWRVFAVKLTGSCSTTIHA